jgi:hypothetical protein
VIHTEDDREFSSGRVEPLWEPPNGLPTDAELEEKFVGIAEPVLGPQKVQELTRMIWNFEKMDEIKSLINGCIRGQSLKK